ncbi:MAG TPA: hypothetical protein VNC78_01325 [Actinomycetota bacterium]|nr:hypothetical protein [Actinomycetota bacterium]
MTGSAFTATGTENRMRWDRTSPGFMEVWYLTLNHRASGAGIWVRYTITSPKHGAAFCELWSFYFDPAGTRSFAGKQRFPIEMLGAPNGRDDGALIRIGDAWLSENHAEGSVATSDGEMTWSLDWEPAERCFQHLPHQIRDRIEGRVSTVCSPNLAVPFSGSVSVKPPRGGGRALRVRLDGDEGCQSHRWGAKHSVSWTWAHCAGFSEDPDGVFEGLAARAGLGPVLAPTTTFLYLRFRGQDLVFNELRWALRAKSRYEMPTWAFTAYNERWKIAGAARSRIDNMFQIAYTDPDGSKRHCANSEIADMALEVYERSSDGWRHSGSLTSTGLAHLEFGRRDPFSELPVRF